MYLRQTTERISRIFLMTCLGLFAILASNSHTGMVYAQERTHRITQPVSTVSQQQIEKLVAPIALYPDALLAQVLTAAVYPGDIVRAARWLDGNQKAAAQQNFSSADAQNWDPSVKALLRFPTVLEKMNAELDWVTDLGRVFVSQPKDVAAAVQYLREQASTAGILQSNAQHIIRRARDLDREFIYIEPVQEDIIYVPTYDPVLAYRPYAGNMQAAFITFGTAVVIRTIIARRDLWNWRTGMVYRPFWPGYPATRPNAVAMKPWRPDRLRYRPDYVARPALIKPSKIQHNLNSHAVSRYERIQRNYTHRAPIVRRPAVVRSNVTRSYTGQPTVARPQINKSYVTRPTSKPKKTKRENPYKN